VQRELHTRLGSDRDDAFHETPETLPERVVTHLAGGRVWSIPHQRVVVRGDQRAAATGRRRRGPRPVEDGHPVPADHRDANRAEIADQSAAALDLLVGPGQPQLCRVQPREAGLDHLQRQPGIGEAGLHPQQRQKLPPGAIHIIRRHLRHRMRHPRLPRQRPRRIRKRWQVLSKLEHTVPHPRGRPNPHRAWRQ
jgi:hypothetical protein